MREATATEENHVRGDATGLPIPAHAEALRTGGAAFLSAAFHAYGSLSEDNRVARITRCDPCLVGSTGQKVFLSVEYEHDDTALPNDLFVKFSRHFEDSFHDRRRFELESEIHLYELSRTPGFPIEVPPVMFGDFHRTSGTGLLITAQIGFGSGGIEPLRAKCLDQDLADPIAYYRAILSSLARLAGAHKSGRLSPAVDRLFPFDREDAEQEDPIPWNEQDIRDLVERYASFAGRCPQFLPEELAAPDFIARLEQYVLSTVRGEAAIKRYLHEDPDYIALSHFNANIDNAWFWRDSSGVLQCGLFDWQRARQMNLGYALWGGLCGAGRDIWNNHLDELLEHFVDEFRRQGGPRLDAEKLALCLHLYAATIGVSGLLNAPMLIESRMPEVARLSGPQDPAFVRNEGARCFLHVFTNFLNLWELHEFGDRMDAFLRSIAGMRTTEWEAPVEPGATEED